MGGVGKRVVRESPDFIEAHLAEDVTVRDIATGVRMSVRAVQQGFRYELGTYRPVGERLGGPHPAGCVPRSVDFAEVERSQVERVPAGS